MISTVVALVVIALLVAADQITKYLISSSYALGESHHIIRGLLDFTYVQNKGAAFSMLSNHRWLFLILTVVLLGVIVWVWCKGYVTHITGKLAAVLIFAGGVGNMIDRLSLGYVVDFIDISPLFSFAIFNVADCCVTVGAVFMAVYLFFYLDEKTLGKMGLRIPEPPAPAAQTADEETSAASSDQADE